MTVMPDEIQDVELPSVELLAAFIYFFNHTTICNCIEPYWAWWGAEKRIRIQSSRRVHMIWWNAFSNQFHFKSQFISGGGPRDNRFEFISFSSSWFCPKIEGVMKTLIRSFWIIDNVIVLFCFGTFGTAIGGADEWGKSYQQTIFYAFTMHPHQACYLLAAPKDRKNALL